MKKIGLLGGTSWHSSIDYYRLLNQEVNNRLGGVASADLILRSVNFAVHHQHQVNGEWDKILAAFAADARQMEQMGAQAIVICANTMHKVASDLQHQLSIPILHIADAVADAAKQNNCQSLAVLGTIFTMEQDFYRDALERNGLTMLVPEKAARVEVNRIIYEELVVGTISQQSQQYYCQVIEQLTSQEADAIVLGCTEIGLLVKPDMTKLPQIDSLKSHVKYICDWMLSDSV
ncbi:MAG: amino acid racemase [Kangiellaceae bacterium]|jgi:aspartate racemase|nr:amino acid racemase [Kangiellaceae bacterium]